MLSINPFHFFELVLKALFLSLCAFSLAAQEPLTVTDRGAEITLALGELSFADSVVRFDIGSPSSEPRYSNPKAVLGLPNGNGKNALTLGCGGSIIISFDDNFLVNVEGADLYVFEVGDDVEATKVLISKTGEEWYDVGAIRGSSGAIDIGRFVPEGEHRFQFVKLTDARDRCNGRWPGADIDAVAAIGSVARKIGENVDTDIAEPADINPDAGGQTANGTVELLPAQEMSSQLTEEERQRQSPEPKVSYIDQLLRDPYNMWVGRLDCRRGLGFVDDIFVRPVSVEGRFGLLVMSITERPTFATFTHTTFVGERESEEKYFFARSSGTPGIDALTARMNLKSFSLTVEQNDVLMFAEGSERCQPVELALRSKFSHHQYALVPPAIGKFFEAETQKEICQVLINWAEPFAKEKYGVPPEKAAEIYYDEHFIPVFGTPYDSLSQAQKKDIRNRTDCRKDPILKARFGRISENYMGWLSDEDKVIFSEVSTSSAWSSRAAYMAYRVQENRIAWKEVEDKAIEASESGATEEVFPIFIAMEDLLEKHVTQISETKRQETKEWIENARNKSAKALAEKRQNTVMTSGATGQDMLAVLVKLEKDVPDYFRYLDTETRSALKVERDALILRISQEIVDPVVEAALRLPRTIDGLDKLSETMSVDLAAGSGIRASVLSSALTRLESEKDLRLGELIDLEVAQLDQISSDTRGLRAGLEWRTGFEDTFGAYSGSGRYKTALDEFWKAREALFEELLPEFEQRVSSAKSNDQIDKLYQLYVPTEQDRELLISLEYEFVAESAKE